MCDQIFISYSSADKKIATCIADDLVDEGFNVWLDRFSIEVSDEWPSEIEKGIDNAGVFLVLWSKNAKESKWVSREIARADRQNITIVPLILDDTDVDIHLERIQHIDFRTGYLKNIRELIVFLERLVHQAKEHPLQITGDYWKWVPDPGLRNRFLHENGYLERPESEEYAKNSWTNRLVQKIRHDDHIWTQASHYLTVVVVPDGTPLPIDVANLDREEKNLVEDILEKSRAANPNANSRLFPINAFHQKSLFGRDFSWFTPSGLNAGPNQLRQYFRLSQDGAIELASSKVLVNHNGALWFWGYIGILGLTWQLLNFSAMMYESLLGYKGAIQLIISLIGTDGTSLAHFASGKYGDSTVRGGWHDFFSIMREWGDPPSPDELQEQMCGTKNIQFVYQVDCERLLKAKDEGLPIIQDLGRRLQACFGFSPDQQLFFVPNTAIFPWHQYYHIWR